jgi:hypothetical protein
VTHIPKPGRPDPKPDAPGPQNTTRPVTQIRDHGAAERALQERLQQAERQVSDLQDLASAQQAGVERAGAQLVESEARARALEMQATQQRVGDEAAVQEVRTRWVGGLGVRLPWDVADWRACLLPV